MNWLEVKSYSGESGCIWRLFFVNNKPALIESFSACYGTSLSEFAHRHKKGISNVIYYLEHMDHGNLVMVYGRDAYKLLEINDLEPEIGLVRDSLYKDGMYLIDNDGIHKDIDSLIRK